MRSTRSKLSAIGLAISPRWISAVQVRRDRHAAGAKLAVAARLPRQRTAVDPTADELVRAIEALERQGFRGPEVILSTPSAKLLSGVFALPPRSSGAPLDQIARNELARAHRAEPGEIECGWWEVPPGVRETEGSQVIAIGCRHADSIGLVSVCEEAGLNVLALDAPGPALARAMRHAVTPSPALTGVLELDSDGAHLVVLRGETIVYERALAEGGLSAIASQLGKKLGIDIETAEYLIGRVGLDMEIQELKDESELLDEARAIIAEGADQLAVEVRASASYAGRRFGENVDRLLIAGEGASIPGLVKRLARKLETEARSVSIEDVLNAPYPEGEIAVSAFAPLVLATGLALHQEGAR